MSLSCKMSQQKKTSGPSKDGALAAPAPFAQRPRLQPRLGVAGGGGPIRPIRFGRKPWKPSGLMSPLLRLIPPRSLDISQIYRCREHIL